LEERVSETRRRPDDDSIEDLVGIAPDDSNAADALEIAARTKPTSKPASEPPIDEEPAAKEPR
jgi:hypothetical protein